ncbi:hypothetical protein RDI58_014703 [Solanum bulbocastanum]|uniref:Uncharacterized protein n=1 Tax=Solanum bulbocastanum TaxID=147425 RepID=A0AAN8YE73_SOLBU
MVYELQKPSPITFISHLPSTTTSTLKLHKGLEQKSVEKDQCRTDTCSFSYTEAMDQFPVLYDVDSDESPSTIQMKSGMSNLRPTTVQYM